MRSGLPSSSSPFPAKVAMLGCCGGFGFAGVAACLLQSAISTPVTINPKPVAVPPSPIKIGDISTEDVDSPANEISTLVPQSINNVSHVVAIFFRQLTVMQHGCVNLDAFYTYYLSICKILYRKKLKYILYPLYV